jgi:isopenicillin-N N-acyltransferase-like protein
LLAGTQAGGECSLVAGRDAGGAWLAQTWDWHPACGPAAVAWTVEHERGWFQTVTEAGVLAKLGHNSHGVACGLNFLTCSEDGGRNGLPIHVLLRMVLERCANGAEARAYLSSARTAASSCITVAAGDELFSAELSPGGPEFIDADLDGLLVHTNHFLRPPRIGTDPMPAAHPGTLDRFRYVTQAARDGASPEQVLAQHSGGEEPVCRHDDRAGTEWADRRATLLAVWAQPARRTLLVAPGPPCTTRFIALRTP